jgi:acyl-coenzyme A synthetase/AMP-(fatty) acid ligase
LHKHPLLADAAVIGIPHEAFGEAPRAYVVPKLGTDGKHVAVDPGEIAEMVKEHVSEHKYLSGGVQVVDSLPKSQTGKILRRHLKDDYLKNAGQS